MSVAANKSLLDQLAALCALIPSFRQQDGQQQQQQQHNAAQPNPWPAGEASVHTSDDNGQYCTALIETGSRQQRHSADKALLSQRLLTCTGNTSPAAAQQHTQMCPVAPAEQHALPGATVAVPSVDTRHSCAEQQPAAVSPTLGAAKLVGPELLQLLLHNHQQLQQRESAPLQQATQMVSSCQPRQHTQPPQAASSRRHSETTLCITSSQVNSLDQQLQQAPVAQPDRLPHRPPIPQTHATMCRDPAAAAFQHVPAPVILAKTTSAGGAVEYSGFRHTQPPTSSCAGMSAVQQGSALPSRPPDAGEDYQASQQAGAQAQSCGHGEAPAIQQAPSYTSVPKALAADNKDCAKDRVSVAVAFLRQLSVTPAQAQQMVASGDACAALAELCRASATGQALEAALEALLNLLHLATYNTTGAAPQLPWGQDRAHDVQYAAEVVGCSSVHASPRALALQLVARLALMEPQQYEVNLLHHPAVRRALLLSLSTTESSSLQLAGLCVASLSPPEVMDEVDVAFAAATNRLVQQKLTVPAAWQDDVTAAASLSIVSMPGASMNSAARLLLKTSGLLGLFAVPTTSQTQHQSHQQQMVAKDPQPVRSGPGGLPSASDTSQPASSRRCSYDSAAASQPSQHRPSLEGMGFGATGMELSVGSRGSGMREIPVPPMCTPMGPSGTRQQPSITLPVPQRSCITLGGADAMWPQLQSVAVSGPLPGVFSAAPGCRSASDGGTGASRAAQQTRSDLLPPQQPSTQLWPTQQVLATASAVAVAGRPAAFGQPASVLRRPAVAGQLACPATSPRQTASASDWQDQGKVQNSRAHQAPRHWQDSKPAEAPQDTASVTQPGLSLDASVQPVQSLSAAGQDSSAARPGVLDVPPHTPNSGGQTFLYAFSFTSPPNILHSQHVSASQHVQKANEARGGNSHVTGCIPVQPADSAVCVLQASGPASTPARPVSPQAPNVLPTQAAPSPLHDTPVPPPCREVAQKLQQLLPIRASQAFIISDVGMHLNHLTSAEHSRQSQCMGNQHSLWLPAYTNVNGAMVVPAICEAAGASSVCGQQAQVTKVRRHSMPSCSNSAFQLPGSMLPCPSHLPSLGTMPASATAQHDSGVHAGYPYSVVARIEPSTHPTASYVQHTSSQQQALAATHSGYRSVPRSSIDDLHRTGRPPAATGARNTPSWDVTSGRLLDLADAAEAAAAAAEAGDTPRTTDHAADHDGLRGLAEVAAMASGDRGIPVPDLSRLRRSTAGSHTAAGPNTVLPSAVPAKDSSHLQGDYTVSGTQRASLPEVDVPPPAQHHQHSQDPQSQQPAQVISVPSGGWSGFLGLIPSSMFMPGNGSQLLLPGQYSSEMGGAQLPDGMQMGIPATDLPPAVSSQSSQQQGSQPSPAIGLPTIPCGLPRILQQAVASSGLQQQQESLGEAAQSMPMMLVPAQDTGLARLQGCQSCPAASGDHSAAGTCSLSSHSRRSSNGGDVARVVGGKALTDISDSAPTKRMRGVRGDDVAGAGASNQ